MFDLIMHLRYLSEEQKKLSKEDLLKLPWLGALRTTLSDVLILKEIPNKMKDGLKLKELYDFLSAEVDAPEERQVLSDIARLAKESTAITYRGIGININERDCLPCIVNKITCAVNMGAIDITKLGLLAALKPDPDVKFVVYNLNVGLISAGGC